MSRSYFTYLFKCIELGGLQVSLLTLEDFILFINWLLWTPRLFFHIIFLYFLFYKSEVFISLSEVDGQTWASWIQAIGGIATAIIACLALYQWRHEKKYTEKKEILHALDKCIVYIDTLREILNTGDNIYYEKTIDYLHSLNFKFFKSSVEIQELCTSSVFIYAENCNPKEIRRDFESITKDYYRLVFLPDDATGVSCLVSSCDELESKVKSIIKNIKFN